MHGEWIRDGVGLVAHADASGWFAHPFGGEPPLGPFTDENAAKSALEREEEAEAPGWSRAQSALTVDGARLEGGLVLPPAASAIVLFVPGDGPCAASPCYAEVARALEREGIATLRIELLGSVVVRDSSGRCESVDSYEGALDLARQWRTLREW